MTDPTAAGGNLPDDALKAWAEHCWGVYHESAKPGLVVAWQRNGHLDRILSLEPACKAEIEATMRAVLDNAEAGEAVKARFVAELGAGRVAAMSEADVRHAMSLGVEGGIAWAKANVPGGA